MTLKCSPRQTMALLLLTLLAPDIHAEDGAAPASTAPSTPTKKVSIESDQSMEELFERKRFSLNVKNAEIREVLRVIADRGSLELKLGSSITGKIQLSLKEATLGEALDRLAEDHGLDYLIEGDRLIVKKVEGRRARLSARNPAQTTDSGLGTSGSSTGYGSVREIPVRYAEASQILAQVRPLLEKDDLVILDELANSIVFQGSEASYQKVLEFIKVLDRLPQQVLIEAQVVETSRSFLQAYGLSWGNSTPRGLLSGDQTLAARVNAPGPNPMAANGAVRLNVGSIAGGNLEVTLSAAESNGDARVISRPKVVTLNNTPADIDSGVSFYIKTLSAMVAGAGGAGGGVGGATGGVSRLRAGLSLSVTPTIMGKDMVKLKININNSTPDESQAVDGIPGIINNSAQTSVIISEGRTAVIAGLVKNTGGKSTAGLPFFRDIPILGALFRNSTYSDRNNELVMFITPQIVTPQLDLKPEKRFGEPKVRLPATDLTSSGT